MFKSQNNDNMHQGTESWWHGCCESMVNIHWEIKKKLPFSYQFLVEPLSAIQPFSYPFDINFPRSLDYIRKLAFGSPWGNYIVFHSRFMCSQHTSPRNIKPTQTYQATNSYLGRAEPRGFILMPVRRNSR